MTQLGIIIHCTVVPTDGETPTDLESHFDAVADEFHGDQGIEDQSVSYDLSDGRMSFDMVIVADDLLQAVMNAYSHVRSAIHGAGGETPGWEIDVQDLSHELEREPTCA